MTTVIFSFSHCIKNYSRVSYQCSLNLTHLLIVHKMFNTHNSVVSAWYYTVNEFCAYFHSQSQTLQQHFPFYTSLSCKHFKYWTKINVFCTSPKLWWGKFWHFDSFQLGSQDLTLLKVLKSIIAFTGAC